MIRFVNQIRKNLQSTHEFGDMMSGELFGNEGGDSVRERLQRNREKREFDELPVEDRSNLEFIINLTIKKNLMNGEVEVHREPDVFYKYMNMYLPGFVLITNFRLVFFEIPEAERSRSQYKSIFPVGATAPRCSVFKIKKDGRKKHYQKPYGYSITLRMKYLQVLHFSLNPELNTRGQIVKLLKTEIFPNSSFAYSWRRRDDGMLFRRHVYDIEREYGLRQKLLALEPTRIQQLHAEAPHITSPYEASMKNWRITTINVEYKFAETYPALFVVPKDVTDDELKLGAKSRSKARIPILCWAEKNTGLSITRSAQPLVGLGIKGKSNLDDQRVIQRIINNTVFKNRLTIVDLRPRINAEANRFRGGGYEKGYKRCEILYLGIENIHKMRSSFVNLMEAIFQSGGNDKDFLQKVSNSQWLQHTRLLLRSALFCCKCLEKEKQSVLIHCSDGWDRTSQCVCLTELLIDPYYRTLEGFVVMIEKEWLAPGHQFQKRVGTGLKEWLEEGQRSPIFLQFCEGVRCLMEQHPTSFEFSDDLLIFLMDELYYGRYGNFLFDFESQRMKHHVFEKTEDIWHYVFDIRNKQRFLNPFYDPVKTRRTIVPDLRMGNYRLWNKYWLRYAKEREIKNITDSPASPFHYNMSFLPPTTVLQNRGREMMKDLTETVATLHMERVKTERKFKQTKDEKIQMSRTMAKMAKENEELKLGYQQLEAERNDLRTKLAQAYSEIQKLKRSRTRPPPPKPSPGGRPPISGWGRPERGRVRARARGMRRGRATGRPISAPPTVIEQPTQRTSSTPPQPQQQQQSGRGGPRGRARTRGRGMRRVLRRNLRRGRSQGRISYSSTVPRNQGKT